jgi:hypothetical protein
MFGMISRMGRDYYIRHFLQFEQEMIVNGLVGAVKIEKTFFAFQNIQGSPAQFAGFQG